jgi:plastocyanin
MSIFKITIKAGNPATYSPTPLVAYVNDSVFWFNSDKVAHWPTPNAATPKAWLDFQIAPDSESTSIALNPPAPYTLNYVCSLHPGEKGQIKVGSGQKKEAFAGKTKKGAFAKKTKKSAFAKKTKPKSK